MGEEVIISQDECGLVNPHIYLISPVQMVGMVKRVKKLEFSSSLCHGDQSSRWSMFLGILITKLKFSIFKCFALWFLGKKILSSSYGKIKVVLGPHTHSQGGRLFFLSLKKIYLCFHIALLRVGLLNYLLIGLSLTKMMKSNQYLVSAY